MKKGFTLIELMIVVVIIGILAAIAIPKFSSVKEQAERVSCRSNLRSLGTGESMYYGEFNHFVTVINLGISGVMDNANLLECPTFGTGPYVASVANSTEYIIPCPINATSLHGSMDDGITSWQ